MNPFVYQASSQRVVFGAGSLAALGDELERLGVARALILTTPGQRVLGEQVAALLGERGVGLFDRAVMHVPVDVARAGREEAVRLGADCCVVIGGGSAIGLAKAIALESGLPIVAVPTTYSGSEVTSIYGLTDNRLKKTGRDSRVLPKTVIYDPRLTLGLSPEMSACSGINAMAHAVEALYASDTSPVTSLMAEESIRALVQSLPRVVDDPGGESSRSQALYGAWLAGLCLNAVGMGLHHKLCHTLGGTFNLPHAQTHAIVLPHAVHYNHRAAVEPLRRAARALGGREAAEVGPLIFSLNQRLGIPSSLAEIGLPLGGPAEAARIACSSPYNNPRPLEQSSIEALLTRACNGEAPADVVSVEEGAV